MKSEKRFYGAVALIAAVVMGLQILQSRLFSVTTWYHLSFLVISIAMFGLTLGALAVYRQDEKSTRRDCSLIARQAAFYCGLCILLSLATQLFVPLLSENPWQTLAILPFMAGMTGAAYYFAGKVLTVSLTRAPYPVGKIYAADLAGAAAGCLGALALMNVVDTPSGLVLLAAMAALSSLFYEGGKSPRAKKIKSRAQVLFFTAALFSALNASMPKPLVYPLWVKNVYAPIGSFDYEKWNAISRITVGKEKADTGPFLWGPSRTLPGHFRSSYSELNIDNDAGTPITRLESGKLKAQRYLEYDITNLAYRLPGLRNAAIIGVGGGRDVLSAKYFGVKNVTALDVNPVQIHLLKSHPFYAPYAGLAAMEGVTLVNSEARSWFRQNEAPFDVIEMSLIDTWAATGAGAFALSENGLYTRDAWAIFFHDLSPHGVFTVSRWAVEGYIDDTARLLSLAISTLFKEGIRDPKQHVFLASSGRIVTLVLAKSPFTAQQLGALHSTAKKMRFNILASPRIEKPEGVFGKLLNASGDKALNAASAQQFYDISPPTDMRPFFFNQARLSNPLNIAELAFKGGPATLYGQAKATFNLFLIIVFSTIVSGLVIALPARQALESSALARSFVLSGAFYFFLIGLGFMLIEVSLLQAFGVYLGHPVYGLSIVLFSLILSTGAGSYLSELFPLRTAGRQAGWCLMIFLYALFLAASLAGIFSAFAEISLYKRAAISVTLLSPLGLLLGYGFPTGISLTARIDSKSSAWFWGINGAAGVLGSALAIALNISLGIDATLALAGLAYLLLLIPVRRLAAHH